MRVEAFGGTKLWNDLASIIGLFQRNPGSIIGREACQTDSWGGSVQHKAHSLPDSLPVSGSKNEGQPFPHAAVRLSALHLKCR